MPLEALYCACLLQPPHDDAVVPARGGQEVTLELVFESYRALVTLLAPSGKVALHVLHTQPATMKVWITTGGLGGGLLRLFNDALGHSHTASDYYRRVEYKLPACQTVYIYYWIGHVVFTTVI